MDIKDIRGEAKPSKKSLFKLSGGKHTAVIAGILILAMALAVYVYTEYGDRTEEGVQSYYEQTEQKLSAILSGIKGAGKVEVMICYDGGAELVVAYDESTVTDSKTDNSGGNEYTVTTTTQEKTPVMSGGELVVLKEKNPEIVGVLVVAEGADDIGVRLELLNAAATVLQVDKKIITVSVKG